MEDIYEIFPEDYYPEIRHWILERSAQETLVAMQTCPHLPKNELYTFSELYERLKKCGHRRTRFGKRSLINDLTNLWRCKKISKFCRGIYKRSNAPYGVKWLVAQV